MDGILFQIRMERSRWVRAIMAFTAEEPWDFQHYIVEGIDARLSERSRHHPWWVTTLSNGCRAHSQWLQLAGRGGGTTGTATINKPSKSRKTPRAGKAPLFSKQIRSAKRAVGRQPAKAKSKVQHMHYLRCGNISCRSEDFLENEADGQQYCTKCGWKKR